MPPSQATLGSIGSPHPWMLAYPLLAYRVGGARCTGSSTMPLASTPLLARSRHAYKKPRTRVRRGHQPHAAIAGHFGLGQLASPVVACVSVARVPCGGRTVHGLEHNAARNFTPRCSPNPFFRRGGLTRECVADAPRVGLARLCAGDEGHARASAHYTMQWSTRPALPNSEHATTSGRGAFQTFSSKRKRKSTRVR